LKTIAAGMLAAALLLSGCSGSSDEPAPTATPTDVARSLDGAAVDQQAKEQAEQTKKAQDELADDVAAEAGTVRIAIKDGKVTPQGGRVEVRAGQKVTLQMTSDAEEEIHVHSDPEHSYEIAPGESLTKSFTLDTPGQVAVEAHHLDVTIVQLVVRP
jgi:major membrane immunogen (membrane-anchored lipoprotein)